MSGRLLLETPDESIQHTFNVNSLAHFWATKAFLPAMLERNSGHLVFMASVAGMHGAARMVDYCSSKFAVVGFEESLRAELTKLGSSGVRTSCICPAHVKTDLFMGYDPGTIYASLTPKYVAYKVIEAVQQGDVVVLLPSHLWLASVVKGALLRVVIALSDPPCMAAFLPTDWVNTLKHAVRVNDSMDTFVRMSFCSHCTYTHLRLRRSRQRVGRKSAPPKALLSCTLHEHSSPRHFSRHMHTPRTKWMKTIDEDAGSAL